MPEQESADQGQDFKAGQNEYANLSASDAAREMVKQTQSDEQATEDLQDIRDYHTTEKAAPFIDAALDASKQATENRKQEFADAVMARQGEFIEAAQADMKAEMTDRTERNVLDDDISARADKMIADHGFNADMAA